MELDKDRILENWKNWNIETKLPIQSNRLLTEQDIVLLKPGKTRSVWRINVPISNGMFPVILKVYHGNKTFRKFYEWKVYQHLENTLVSEFLTESYEIKTDLEKSEVWLFLKCLDVFGEKSSVSSLDLYNITLRLAQLHAATFEHQKISRLIRRTIPAFQTELRDDRLENLKNYLQQAKKDRVISEVIEQNCPEIYKLTERTVSFPEIIRAGQCMTHGDLHLENVCYDHEDQKIKFIDLGVVTFSPCWLDLVKLVETALDGYVEAEQGVIRDQCIHIYVQEMKRKGIIFSEDSGRLYRLAFLMRMFEKELRRHLQAALKGKKPFKAEQLLRKIAQFSQELHLIE